MEWQLVNGKLKETDFIPGEDIESFLRNHFLQFELFYISTCFQTLKQTIERIPTISTQLKIVATVKATMIGADGKLCFSF